MLKSQEQNRSGHDGCELASRRCIQAVRAYRHVGFISALTWALPRELDRKLFDLDGRKERAGLTVRTRLTCSRQPPRSEQSGTRASLLLAMPTIGPST